MATSDSLRKTTKQIIPRSTTAKAAQCSSTPRKPKDQQLVAISEQERKKLSGLPFDAEQFETFLREELGMKDGVYTKDIVGEAKLLVSGRGISNQNWGYDIAFGQNQFINLTWDFHKLLEQAKAFKVVHGAAKGRGKSLRLPIQKLGLYQQYLLKQIKLETPIKQEED